MNFNFGKIENGLKSMELYEETQFFNGINLPHRQAGSTNYFVCTLCSRFTKQSFNFQKVMMRSRSLTGFNSTYYFVCTPYSRFTKQSFIKNGKLPTSHRYNLIPLLRSRPGGFKGSWLCRTCRCKNTTYF